MGGFLVVPWRRIDFVVIDRFFFFFFAGRHLDSMSCLG